MDGDKQYKVEILEGKVNINVSDKNGRNRFKVKGPVGKF